MRIFPKLRGCTLLALALLMSVACNNVSELVIPNSPNIGAEQDGNTSTGEGMTAEEIEALFVPTWDDEYYEYSSPAGAKRVDIVKDYSAANDGVADASPALQAAIDETSTNGGGEVYIPKGEYRFKSINMKSNVTILVEAGTIIRPMYGEKNEEKTPPVSVFNFAGAGTDGVGPIENVQMIGLNGRFTVELEKRANKLGTKLFLFSRIDGFRVSNVNIKDVRTTYPMFTFNPTAVGTKDKEGNDMMGCRNGIITHARVDSCHYGYGLTQLQAATNMHLEKISGLGGVTLRCETGAQNMNNNQWGGIHNITGKDVYCKSGNASAMVSPHGMHNGDVTIDHIVSESCGSGLRLDSGYLSDKDDEGLVTTPGTYQNVKVSRIHARYGTTAQIKSKSQLPDQLHYLCAPFVDKVSEPAPAIAAITKSMKEVEDAKTVVIEEVIAIGYLTPPIMTGSWADYVAGK